MAEYKIDTYQKVFIKILNFVSYKPRTQKEIGDRLSLYIDKEKISSSEKEDLRQKIMVQLKSDGYINDKKVAGLYLESFISSPKARSIGRFKRDLKKKGFAETEIEDITGTLPEDAEMASALKEGKKKLLGLKNEPAFAKKAKLSNFLYSKGYTNSTIRRVVDTLLSLQ